MRDNPTVDAQTVVHDVREPPHLIKRLLIIAALLALPFTGCSEPDYDPPTLIKNLRVLAVRAEPPYLGIAPTNLSTFSVGQTEGAELCYAWALCAFAWENNGNYECLDPDLQVDLGNGATAKAGLLDLAPALEKLPAVLAKKGLQPPNDVNVDGATDSNTEQQQDVEAANGLEVKILFQVSEARVWGGTCPKDTAKMLAKPCPTRDGCMFGHKGLEVAIPRQDGKPVQAIHTNPTLEMLALNGVPWPADVTPTIAVYKAAAETDLNALNDLKGVELRPVWPETSEELIAKSKEPGIPDRKERMIFSFFSNAGAFQYRRTGDSVPENGYQSKTPADGKTTQTVAIWVVMRDGRGGTDWTKRHLIVDTTAPAEQHPLCGPDPSLPKCDEVKP